MSDKETGFDSAEEGDDETVYTFTYNTMRYNVDRATFSGSMQHLNEAMRQASLDMANHFLGELYKGAPRNVEFYSGSKLFTFTNDNIRDEIGTDTYRLFSVVMDIHIPNWEEFYLYRVVRKYDGHLIKKRYVHTRPVEMILIDIKRKTIYCHPSKYLEIRNMIADVADRVDEKKFDAGSDWGITWG